MTTCCRLCFLLSIGLLASSSVSGQLEITVDQVDAWRSELMPLVEEFAAGKFAAPPVIRIVEPDVVSSSARRDMETTLRAQYPDEQQFLDKVIDLAVPATAASNALLGRYSYTAKEVCFAPARVAALLQSAGIAAEFGEPIVRLLLAHELTHALQDQRIDLGKQLARLRTPEEQAGYLRLMEGHAVWVQRRVAERLGLEAAERELQRLMPGGAPPEAVAALPREQQEMRAAMSEAYTSGYELCERVVREHGPEMMWTMLTARVGSGAAPAGPSGGRSELADLLDGLAPLLGRESWTQTLNLDVSGARGLKPFSALAAERQRAIAEQVVAIQSLLCVDRSTDREQIAGVLLYRLTSADLAEGFATSVYEAHDAAAASQAKGRGLLTRLPPQTIRVGARDVNVQIRKITIRGANPPEELALLAAALPHAEYVVQVYAVGRALDPGVAGRALGEVQSRLSAKSAGKP